jgi:hypothetical protein
MLQPITYLAFNVTCAEAGSLLMMEKLGARGARQRGPCFL